MAVRTDDGQIIQRGLHLSLVATEGSEMVDMGELLAQTAVDFLEAEATARHLAPHATVGRIPDSVSNLGIPKRTLSRAAPDQTLFSVILSCPNNSFVLRHKVAGAVDVEGPELLEFPSGGYRDAYAGPRDVIPVHFVVMQRAVRHKVGLQRLGRLVIPESRHDCIHVPIDTVGEVAPFSSVSPPILFS